MSTCEVPLGNPTTQEIKAILLSAKIIAVIGLSDKPARDSYKVAFYLKQNGYKIAPINPNVPEILDERSYSRLEDVPFSVDIVDIFRRPEFALEIVESAIKIGAKVVWMQEGIVHNVAARKAIENGLKVIMNKCIMKEHKKIISISPPA